MSSNETSMTPPRTPNGIDVNDNTVDYMDFFNISDDEQHLVSNKQQISGG